MGAVTAAAVHIKTKTSGPRWGVVGVVAASGTSIYLKTRHPKAEALKPIRNDRRLEKYQNCSLN